MAYNLKIVREIYFIRLAEAYKIVVEVPMSVLKIDSTESYRFHANKKVNAYPLLLNHEIASYRAIVSAMI